MRHFKGDNMEEEIGMTREQQPALTLEAQSAIRHYLWRFMVPSSLTLAVLSGLLGFYIRDIAIQKATHDAYAAVQKTTMEMAQKTIEAKTRADMAVKEVEELRQSAKSQIEKVDAQMKILDERAKQLASVIANLETQAREQASVLASSPEHASRIASCLAGDPRVTKLVQEFILTKEDSFQRLDSATQKLEAIRTLQVECKKLTVRPAEKKKTITFSFPVKDVWIESGNPALTSLQLVEKVEKNTVTLQPRESGMGTFGWPADDEIECKVCAAGLQRP
jgi:hypothetical protein